MYYICSTKHKKHYLFTKKFNKMETKNNTKTAITKAGAKARVEKTLSELEFKALSLYDDVLEMKTMARYTQRDLTNFADWVEDSAEKALTALSEYRKAIKVYNNIKEDGE